MGVDVNTLLRPNAYTPLHPNTATPIHSHTTTLKDVARKSAAASLSGVLLFCSFPPLEYSWFAWIALFPVVFLCTCSEPRKSFLYGLLAGIIFWLAGIFWLTRVSFIGWIFVSLYCSLYGACFALIVSWWFDRRRLRAGGGQNVLSDLTTLLGVPAVWVGLEYARSHFLTGFPWNLLGISQYSCGPIIQCAEWGGVYLVSYLIVMVNTAVALLLLGSMKVFRRGWGQPAAVLSVSLLIVSFVFAYGKWREKYRPTGLETIKIAAVQANVPQQNKWSEEWADDIYRRLRKATETACMVHRPDLVVWPETALPDFVRYNAPSSDLVKQALQNGIPHLIGSMDYESLPGETNYYNSSFLFLPGNDDQQVYAKRHLVIFGEYVPFARFFPFLRTIAEVEEDFTPGVENVVFRLDNEQRAFSVLICFEDTLPYLARECVKAGARLLINQTNDAWFDPSWASRQHMAHCVFRCVENRVACLRAANTGMTCLIDRQGVIRSFLEPLGRAPREPQVLRAVVEFSPKNMPLTFYTRHGDIFALGCGAFSLPLFAGALLNLRRKRSFPNNGCCNE